MTYRYLTDMATVLRAGGLTVIELDGWKSRGEQDGQFDPIACLLHHDGMGLGWNTDPSDDMNVPKYMSQNGVNGSQVWVRKDGVWVMLAAGRKWHAGKGSGWKDIPADSGNTLMIGIETDHTIGDPWPQAQVDAIYLGSHLLNDAYGFKPSNCCGHKEYAPGRKTDPENFDLNAWRSYLSKPIPEEDDTLAGISIDDIRQVVKEEVKAALEVEDTPVVDVAHTPNSYKVSVKGGIARLVRLEAQDVTGVVLASHDETKTAPSTAKK